MTTFEVGNTAGRNFDRKRRSENRCVLHPQGLRRCKKCGQVKEFSSFPIKAAWRGRKNRLNTNCKACENSRLAIIRDKQKRDPALYCKVVLRSLRSRAKEMELPFDLTAKLLHDQWSEQRGLCFYTKVPMDLLAATPKRNSPHKMFPSVDRLVPSAGYVVDNIVWCLWGVNCMKHNLTKDEFLEFCRLVSRHHE